MMDPPRDEAKEAVRICREVHIRPVMITGDHMFTAVAVAAEVGIYREGDMVLTGDELGRMSDEDFEAIVDKVTVYARVSPMDKLKIVRAWKNRGEVVAMTGDGVNDAPALKHADIGIAMGISGTDVAKEAADMVLGDDNFATIVQAIERGRWIYDNIKKYLTYLLRANITEVVVLGGVVIVVGPELLPLLPAAILYINLATDGLPALALGLSPPDRDIMQRPPRDPTESIFSRDVRLLVLLGVLIECPIFLWIYFSNYADIEVARTKIFLLFVFVELIISMCFRSLRFSLFQAPPHKWLLLAMAWEIALLGVLIQFAVVRETFGIRMPTWPDLGMALAVSAFVVAAIEATKAYLRATTGKSARKAHAGCPKPERSRRPSGDGPQGPADGTRTAVPGARLAGVAQKGAGPASIPQQVAGANTMRQDPDPRRRHPQRPLRRAERHQAVHEQHGDGSASRQCPEALLRVRRAILEPQEPPRLSPRAGGEGARPGQGDAGQVLHSLRGAHGGGRPGDRDNGHGPAPPLRRDRDGDGAQELAHAARREFDHRQGDRAHAGARRGHRGRLDVEVGALRHTRCDRCRGGDGAGDRGLTRSPPGGGST